MGQTKSIESEEKEPEYQQEWRNTPWGEKEHLENDLKNFKLCKENVKYVRILLIGRVGAGKSSFINSVKSVFLGHVAADPLSNVTTNNQTSFTKALTTYHITSGESALPFVLTDTMGLEPHESQGIHPDDIVKALEGFIKEGYKFNPVSAVSSKDDGYRSNPTIHEQALCVVYVMPAVTISFMEPEFTAKFKYIRRKVSELGIPQAIIMTRVDETCPLVQKSLRKIYTSKKIKEKMQECSNLVGVPLSYIYPVKNYHEETDTQNDIDVLVLRAVTNIVKMANDKLLQSDVKT